MRITEIISVPRFLTEYDKESDIFDFSNILLNNDIDCITSNSIIRTDKDKRTTVYMIGTDYVNKDFVEFYLDKSYLNKVTGECKYEDETIVPQSIMNEIFEIKFNNGFKDQVKIKSYNKGVLILESIN